MTAWALAAWLLVAPPAELRLVQALPIDQPATFAVRAGEQRLWQSEALYGGQSGDYHDCPAAKLSVAVTAGEQQIEGEVDLSTGGRFTLVLHRMLGDPFLLLSDPAPAVAADQAVVRWVHAVPDVDTLDVQLRRPHGMEWADESDRLTLQYPSAAPPQTVMPGPITLQLLGPDEDGGEPVEVAQFAGLRLLPGTALTVVICGLGETEDDGDLPVTLVPLVDAIVRDGG